MNVKASSSKGLGKSVERKCDVDGGEKKKK